MYCAAAMNSKWCWNWWKMDQLQFHLKYITISSSTKAAFTTTLVSNFDLYYIRFLVWFCTFVFCQKMCEVFLTSVSRFLWVILVLVCFCCVIYIPFTYLCPILFSPLMHKSRKLWLSNLVYLVVVSVAEWLVHLTAVWEDPGSNNATDSCVYRDSCCDIQSWAQAVHLYCSA